MDKSIINALIEWAIKGQERQELEDWIEEMIYGGKINPYKTLAIETTNKMKELDDTFVKKQYEELKKKSEKYDIKANKLGTEKELRVAEAIKILYRICYDKIKDEESRESLQEEQAKAKERNEDPYFKPVKSKDPKQVDYFEVKTNPSKVEVKKNEKNNISHFPENTPVNYGEGGRHYTEGR